MWVSRESALLRAKPGEEAVKIVEMTVKDLESDMSVVDTAAAGLERYDFNCERSPVGGVLSTSIARCRESVRERKGQLMRETSLPSYFKKSPQPPQPSAAIGVEARPAKRL